MWAGTWHIVCPARGWAVPAEIGAQVGNPWPEGLIVPHHLALKLHKSNCRGQDARDRRTVMVRVEFHDQDNTTTMRIEGRFVGRLAEDVRGDVLAKTIVGRLVVDLSDLSWIDKTGEEVLLWLASIGCLFVAGNAYSSYVCERLNLYLIQEASAKTVASR